MAQSAEQQLVRPEQQSQSASPYRSAAADGYSANAPTFFEPSSSNAGSYLPSIEISTGSGQSQDAVTLNFGSLPPNSDVTINISPNANGQDTITISDSNTANGSPASTTEATPPASTTEAAPPASSAEPNSSPPENSQGSHSDGGHSHHHHHHRGEHEKGSGSKPSGAEATATAGTTGSDSAPSSGSTSADTPPPASTTTPDTPPPTTAPSADTPPPSGTTTDTSPPATTTGVETPPPVGTGSGGAATTTPPIVSASGSSSSSPISSSNGGSYTVYDNGQMNWAGDFSSNYSVDYHDTTGGAAGGGEDIKATPTGSWALYQPYSAVPGNFNDTPYSDITFDMKGNGDYYQIFAHNSGDQIAGPALNLSQFAETTPEAGQWTEYKVPLADLGIANETGAYKFAVQDDEANPNGPTYFDNIQFTSS